MPAPGTANSKRRATSPAVDQDASDSTPPSPDPNNLSDKKRKLNDGTAFKASRGKPQEPTTKAPGDKSRETVTKAPRDIQQKTTARAPADKPQKTATKGTLGRAKDILFNRSPGVKDSEGSSTGDSMGVIGGTGQPMPHSRVPATFLKQVFPSINQGGTTFDLARNQNVLQTLIPPSVLDVDVEMRDVVEHTQLEQLVVHGTLRGSQTVVWSPPSNLGRLLGLLNRKSFPLLRRRETSPTSILSRIEPDEIIQYLCGEKKLPSRGRMLPAPGSSAHSVEPPTVDTPSDEASARSSPLPSEARGNDGPAPSSLAVQDVLIMSFHGITYNDPQRYQTTRILGTAPAGSTTSTSSTTNTKTKDQLSPAESAGLLGSPPQRPPPQRGQGFGPTQGSQLQVAHYSRTNDNYMEIDEIDPAGTSEAPRSPHNTPPIFSYPQHGRSGPASAGPSNNRQQRNKPQDKLLAELGEGVNKMNSNLEVLNSNISVLNSFVKGSHNSRSKKRGKYTDAQLSDDGGTDADADDDEPEVREYRPPKRKTRGQNTLRKLIRAHARTLLKKKSEDPPRCDVTQEEADGFDSSMGYPCTAQNFRLYLAGTPAHKWNQAAVVVFTKSFLQERSEFTQNQVKNCFTTHLRTLISTFKKHQKLEEMAQNERERAKVDAATQGRRSTRKHNLYHLRIEAVKTIGALKRFERFIVALGPGGMSSDETDSEPGTLKTIKTCLIRRPYWRAPEVGLFLHTIDSVSGHLKVHETKPGGQRRRRETRRNLISHRCGVVTGLPVNFYTAEILNQGVGMRDKIDPQDEVDITHNPEIMELAMRPPDKTTVY